MEKTLFEQRYREYLQAIESHLEGLFQKDCRWADLYEAMRYSFLSGGKRIRPVLTLEFTALCGGDWKKSVPAACALELVHTYSLIHDDLPCMDNDDFRRGKPTNHKVFGQTMAILAGDALQPEAFRQILTAPGLTVQQRADCALVLAEAAGADGMVAGQVLDTLHRPASEAELLEVHRLKTGAMIAGACMLGVAACGGDAQMLRAAEEYGYHLGIAFQIRDDMLDVIGTETEFGKPIHSDQEEGKVTFVDLLGLDGCEKAVLEETQKAVQSICGYEENGFLQLLAEQLQDRKK